jgi:hypothetical protein
VYTICLKERGAKKGRAANETVLAYELELPGEGHEGAVQKELNIGHTGTFHIQVKVRGTAHYYLSAVPRPAGFIRV